MQIPTFTRSQLVFSNLFLWEFIICWFFSNKSILQNNNWCFPLSKWFLLLKIKIEVANYINWKLGILFAVIWRKLGNEQIAEVTSSGKICPMANENHICKWIIFHISSFAMIEKKISSEAIYSIEAKLWKLVFCCHFKFCHNGRNQFKLKFGLIENRKGHVLVICQFAWPSLYYNWVLVVQESTIKAGSGSRASRAYSRFLCQLCIYYVTFTKHMQISKTGNNVVRPHLEIYYY